MHAALPTVLAIALPLLAAASSPAERVVTGDGVYNGAVAGVPVRLRIDPATVAMPLITAAVAQRAGLRAGPFAAEYAVGPVVIAAETARATINIGTGDHKRRVAWTTRQVSADVDAVIGPGLLPEDTVRFQLRAPEAGETVSVFPLVDQGGVGARWGERFAAVRYGDRTLKVKFDPRRQATVATAQAGTLIAARNAGHFDGARQEVEIAFGVKRPVRVLQLQQPLVIGSLGISRLLVRTHDFGTVAGIAETASDPNEIVVTGLQKQNPRYDQVTLGNDVLHRCSSITFARREKKLYLRCS